MNSAYYPEGSMMGSGIDDYDFEWYLECENDDECDFAGTMTAVVRGRTIHVECPDCGMAHDYEVDA